MAGIRTPLKNIEESLWERDRASQTLSEDLRSLEGPERIQALQACRDAGIGATELAKLAGISRARLYQLLDKSV